MAGSTANRGTIDFDALARELLHRAESLLADWLPGGRLDNGEWRCGNLRGEPGDSMAVNLRTGVWCDFGGDDADKGSDLISLYAAIHGLEQGMAARQLVDDLRLPGVIRGGGVPAGRGGHQERPKRAAAAPAAPAEDEGEKKRQWQGDKGEFVPLVPVPKHAPAPPREHRFRGEPAKVWKYERDGELYGYVYRFVTSDGGKTVLPCVWGQSRINGTQKWIWKHWEHPKPLYLPAGTLQRGLPVVVVEGEPCADALHAKIGGEFNVVSWAGGGKSADKAAWDWLADAIAPDGSALHVFLWPDADYKRRRPTAEEKAAGIEKDDPRLDYLPAAKQPGLVAMQAIAEDLHARFEAQIWVTRVADPPIQPGDPPPVPDGWDCADAIAAGWDAEQCTTHLRNGRKWEALAPRVDDGPGSAGASEASADPEDADPRAWRLALLRSPETNAIKVARENVSLALQSLPQTRGKIAFNEFTNNVIKLVDMPWGSPAGMWSEVDELLMGEWLVRKHSLPSMPRTTLEEGMRMVSVRNQYHPVREYLGRLRWDGTPRLNRWLIRAVVAPEVQKDPQQFTARTRSYLRRVGAWFLMGMVARAMRPGCKFDYMPILEGAQGMRKSTVLNVLAGDWFADTGFVLGDKDSYQMLQGRWLYEISELDAMARAEVTKIKAFVASKSDWYRASFDKRPREYPRQLVFAGTTNEHQYLVDSTGNRRFWPIDVTRVIDTEWVQEVRDQLFAEAVVRVRQGERYHPTQDEELRLFIPQQKARLVESAIEVKILDYLVNNTEGQLLSKVKTVTILGAIGIDITKLGPGRFHEKQAGAALRKFGWERKKASNKVPGRPWEYVKPSNWPACMNLDDLDAPDDGAPAPAEPSVVPTVADGPADYDDSLPIGEPSIPFDESGSDEPF